MALRDTGICNHDIVYSICIDAMKGITREELMEDDDYNPCDYLPQLVQWDLLEENSVSLKLLLEAGYS